MFELIPDKICILTEAFEMIIGDGKNLLTVTNLM